MDHNLMPPFITREVGVDRRHAPKIQCKNPEEEVHSVCLKEDGMRALLKIHGFFHVLCQSKSQINF